MLAKIRDMLFDKTEVHARNAANLVRAACSLEQRTKAPARMPQTVDRMGTRNQKRQNQLNAQLVLAAGQTKSGGRRLCFVGQTKQTVR